MNAGSPSEEGSLLHPCKCIVPVSQHEPRKDNHDNLCLREKYREEDIDDGIVGNEGCEVDEVESRSVALEAVGEGNVAEPAEEGGHDDGDRRWAEKREFLTARKGRSCVRRHIFRAFRRVV